MSEIFLSICIPSYNRPEELRRLLDSIDATNSEEIEIVIREDVAPKREEVRHTVEEFEKSTKYIVNYIENEKNYGYDKNIRQVAKSASGKWVMFMGDDDVFIPKSLDKYISFLKEQSDLGYVLRRYETLNSQGKIESFRYSDHNVFVEPGESAVVEWFRRSVFISGFCFKRALFTDYDCADYDGTLLFQIYIQSCVCLNNKSAYCDIPITRAIEGGIPYFGKSESEKDLYESGANTYNNSINFLKQTGKLAQSFDEKNNTNVYPAIMKSYSKYSYGYLIEHRDDGIKLFNQYAKEIRKIGLGNSIYFYVYYVALLVLGRQNCQSVIRLMKRIMGHTPKL